MGDFPLLEHLSRKYLDISAGSGHWTDYLKAHGLANACLARDPTREDVRRRIYDLESHWYDGSNPKTYSEHQQRIADHKIQLTKLRSKTEQKLDILEPLQAGLSTDALFSRENMIQLLNFSHEVFTISSECTGNMVRFSRSIIVSSMAMLEEPPCSFAVIGLGSIARGEATPYSDLEYGFLVESGFSNHKYFTDLAVESYFCICNLGESPLKCFDIEELNVKDERDDKLFIDIPPVNGFKIDGISPKAGNIPTGHGREGGKRLILSVDELMSLYKISLMAPANPDVPGDMSDLLFSPVLIHEHKGGEKLLDQFMAKRKVYENSIASTSQHARNKRLGTIVSDIKCYHFIPEFIYGNHTGHSVQVKSEIFRYPTLLATNLKIFSNLDTKYPWETFQWFYNNNGLSPGNHAYLRIMLGLSIYIRTKAYIELGSQYEMISLQPTVKLSQTISDRFHVPQNIFLTLGCLLEPIKRCIERSIVKVRTVYSQLQGMKILDITHSMLKDFHIFGDFLLKAKVLHFMGNSKNAFDVIQSSVGERCMSEAIKFKQAVLNNYQDQQSDSLVKKSLEMMASILITLGSDEAALDYFSWLSFYSESDTESIRWDIQSAQSLLFLNKYKSAESQLRQIEMRLRNILSVEISEPLHTHVIRLLERAGSDKSRINTVLGLSDLVRNMYRLYSMAREGLHYYQQALEDVTRVEQMLGIQSGRVDIRHDLMLVYMNKADIYRCISDNDASENMYTQAIALCKSLYGSDAATTEITVLYNNLTYLYINMGKYSQAEQLAQQALEIIEEISGANHHNTMLSVYLLGSIYYYQGKYLNALRMVRRVLNSNQSSKVIFGPLNVIQMTNYLIGEMYNTLGEYTPAYKFLSAADKLDTTQGLLVMSSYDTNLYTQYLPSVMRSVEEVMTSRDTGTKMRAMLDLGRVCMNFNKLSEALGYLSSSISIGAKDFFYDQEILLSVSEVWMHFEQYKTAVQFSNLVLRSKGETPDSHTGEAHFIIGHCYMKLGLYNKSWSHLHSALCLYQNLPKYRSFVLMLANIHLSIAMLLFELCRVSESLQHAMKAVQFTANLVSDQEKTTRECVDVWEKALILQDTLVLIKARDVGFCICCCLLVQYLSPVDSLLCS